MAARKKVTPLAPNPLLEAFQDYAVNTARFAEARDAAFAAQRALKESADRLASFGIYVSSSPPRATEPALPDDGTYPEPSDEPTTMHSPAPTVERAPVATEVAAIRNAAYEESEQADAENLAASAGSAMSRLLGKLGTNVTAAPVIGHPVRAKADPRRENHDGGPVEQKPTKE